MSVAIKAYKNSMNIDNNYGNTETESIAMKAFRNSEKSKVQPIYKNVQTHYEMTKRLVDSRKSYWDGNDERIKKSAEYTNSLISELKSKMKASQYDDEDAHDMEKSLDELYKYNQSVLNVLQNEQTLYGKFENEEAYNAWKAQSDKFKSYEEMTADELEQAMEDKRSEREAYTQENGSKYANKIGKWLVHIGDDVDNGTQAKEKADKRIKTLDDYDTELQIMQNVLGEKRLAENAKQLEKLPKNVLNAIDTIADAQDMAQQQGIAGLTGQINVVLQASEERKAQEAIQTLERMGYKDWKELVQKRKAVRNAQTAKQERESAEQFTQEHPVIANAAAIGANAIRGVSGIKDVLSVASGEDIDVNDPMHSFGAFADTVRSTTQEDIQSTAGKIAYQVGIGVADNLVRMGIGSMTGGSARVVGMISGAVMGSQVLSQAVVEGKEKGYSDEKALTMGIIQAAIEGATEKWSVETILGNPKNVFLQVGKSFLAEGSEELASNWLNRIAEIIADDDIDDLRTRMNNYKMEGMSDSEAMSHAVFDLMKDDGQAFLVGGLSGALLGAGNAARVTAVESAYRNFEGQSIIDEGNVQELLDAAKLSDDKGTKKLAQTVEKNGKAGNVGKLAQNVEADAQGRMDSIVERYKNGEALNAFELTAMRRNSDAMQSLMADGIPSRRIAQEAGDIGYKALQSYAEQYKDTGAEQAFMQGYKAGQDVDYYAKSFAATYQAGVDGKNLAKLSEAVETNDSFTQEQAIEAHKAGYMEGMTYASEPFNTIQIENDTAKAIAAAELKPGVTLVNMGEDTEIDSVMRTQLSVIQNLGKEKGIAFAIVDNYSGNYDQYNGLQLGGTNKIVISLQAEQGLLLRTAGHETFHYIKQQNAEAAERLQNFVVDYFTKNGKYEALATEYAKNGYEDNIDEEMTADSLFDVMQTKEFIAHYTQTDAQTQKGLKNSVEAFLRHVKQALKRLTMTNRTHRIIAESLQKDKKALEKIRSLFMDALDGIHAEDDVKVIPFTDQKKASLKNSKEIKELNRKSAADLREAFLERMQKKHAENIGIEEIMDIEFVELTANYSGIDEKTAETFQQTIHKLCGEYNCGITKISTVEDIRAKELMHSMAFVDRWSFGSATELFINANKMKEYKKVVESIQNAIDNNWFVFVEEGKEAQVIVTHEFAHGLLFVNGDGNVGNQKKEVSGKIKQLYKEYMEEIKEIKQKRDEKEKRLNDLEEGTEEWWSEFEDDSLHEAFYEIFVSDYAETNEDEFFAECFVQGKLGQNKTKYSNAVMKIIDENFGKNTKKKEKNFYDIKNSVKPKNEIAAENRKLAKENEHLKKIVEQLRAEKTIFKKYMPKPGAVEKVTRKILKETHSSMSKDELFENLVAIYSFMNQDMQTNQDFDLVMETATNVAKCILEQSESKDTTLTEEYKDMRDRLRKGGFTLTETQKMEMRAQFGDLGTFMLRNFGKVQYRTYGIKLDEVWDKLSTLWPEFFDPNTDEADMPMRLIDAYEATSPMYINPYGMDIDAAALDLALRIIEGNFDVPEWKTWAMRNKESREKLIAEQNAWRKQMQQQYKQNIQKVRIEERKRGLDKLWKERERAKEKNAEVVRKTREMLLEQRARQAAALQARSDRSYRAKKKKQIMQTCKALSEKLAKNSAKKNVPLVLKKPIMDLLDTIYAYENTERETGFNKQFVENMRKAYERLDDMRQGEMPDMYGIGIDINDDFMEELRKVRNRAERLIDEYAGKSEAHILDMMNIDELSSLNSVLNSLHSMANNVGILHQNAMYKTSEELSRKSYDELMQLKEKKAHSGIVKSVENFVNLKNLTPYQFFKRLGSGAMTIFNEIQDGWDKHAFNMNKVLSFMDSLFDEKSKERKQWGKQIFEVKDVEGTVFYLTAHQVMSLYCLSKRDAARKHLFVGGITPGQVKNHQQSHSYKIDETALGAIISNLSERQIEVADKMQEFLSTVCSEWGNAVSMKRYGILSFTEDNYFPMSVNDNTIRTGDTPKSRINLFSLINKSFTKILNEKATNPLYVMDIFDVFASHTSEMSLYGTLAIPVLDAMHWYDGRVLIPASGDTSDDTGFEAKDYDTVKSAIEHAYGKEAQRYFEQFIKDINGAVERDRTDLPKKIMGNYKVSKVAGNLNVALVQPSSYFRAANIIDPKYLIKAIGGVRNIKSNIATMQQYSGIGLWKAMGFFDADVSKDIAQIIKSGKSWRENIQEKAMKGAEVADNFTWGLLFYACQLETFDKGKYAFGSNAHNKDAAKRFREVIYATQVVDSTMTRSEMMRSKTGLDQIWTAFMSEPTMTYNMLLEQVSEYQKELRSGKDNKQVIKERLPKIARTVGTYAVVAFATSLLKSISGALRDESEDDAMQKYLSKLGENFMQELDPLDNIPLVRYVNEAVRTVMKKLLHKNVSFSISNPATDTLEEIVTAFNGFSDNNGFLYYTKSDGVIYGNVYAVLVAISSATGLPVSGITRDVVAIWNSTVGNAKPEYKIRRTERTNEEQIEALIEMRNNESRIFVEKMLDDAIEAKRKKGEKGTEDELRKSAVSDLKSSISRKAHQMYLAGEVEQSKELMRKSGLYASDEISKKIKEWSKKAS